MIGRPTQHPRRLTGPLLAASGAAALLILTGCGHGSTDAGPGPTAPTVAASKSTVPTPVSPTSGPSGVVFPTVPAPTAPGSVPNSLVATRPAVPRTASSAPDTGRPTSPPTTGRSIAPTRPSTGQTGQTGQTAPPLASPPQARRVTTTVPMVAGGYLSVGITALTVGAPNAQGNRVVSVQARVCVRKLPPSARGAVTVGWSPWSLRSSVGNLSPWYGLAGAPGPGDLPASTRLRAGGCVQGRLPFLLVKGGTAQQIGYEDSYGLSHTWPARAG